MQRLRRFLFSAALLISLFGMTAFVGVSAASAHVAQPSHPQVTCSGNGCNGQDPESTGCAASAYTVQTAVFSDSYVELRYSPTCGTNWGRVTSKVGAVFLIIRVQRIDGLTTPFQEAISPPPGLRWSMPLNKRHGHVEASMSFRAVQHMSRDLRGVDVSNAVNNHYTSLYLGQDGRAYVGVLTGLISVSQEHP